MALRIAMNSSLDTLPSLSRSYIDTHVRYIHTCTSVLQIILYTYIHMYFKSCGLRQVDAVSGI